MTKQNGNCLGHSTYSVMRMGELTWDEYVRIWDQLVARMPARVVS